MVTIISLNQYLYLSNLAKKQDGEGAWARSELEKSKLSDADQKAWEVWNQVNYLFELAKGSDGAAGWARNGLGTVHGYMKAGGLL